MCVLCIPDFSVSVLLTFINFYCAAPMFLRQFVIGAQLKP